jgi:hypothetical protein
VTDDRSGKPKEAEPVLDSLSRVERAVYDLILRAGDLMAKDIPFKATPGSRKKQTFLKAKKRE